MTRDFDPMNIRIDEEFRTVLPELGEMERAELEKRLRQVGFLPSLGKMVIWFEPGNDIPVMIDGHNRYSICRENNIPLRKEYFSTCSFNSRENAMAWIVTTQLCRRNLTDIQKVEILERFRPQLVERGKKNMSDGGKGSVKSPKVDVRKDLAKTAGMGESKYGDISKVLNSDDEDLKEQLRKGKISAHKAAGIIKDRDKVPETKEDRIRKNEDTLSRNAEKMAQIQDEMEKLREETDRLYCGEDAEIRYKITETQDEINGSKWEVTIFFERDGHRVPLYHGFPEGQEPDESVLKDCPTGRREDFRAVWKAARRDLSVQMDYAKASREAERKRQLGEGQKFFNSLFGKSDPVVEELKEIPADYRKLAGNMLTKLFHPDSQGSITLPEELRDNIPSEYTMYAATIKKCLAAL